MGFRSFWTLFAVSAGLMLSPENLVLLGQGAGATGGAVYIWLMFAIAVHLLTAMSYGAGFLAGASGEVALLAENLGRPAAAVVPVAARFGFALWGSAAVLVTAGYVFNETFVPAYPNLGFSFTLLAALLTINLWFPRVAALFQVAFTLAALAGLAALILIGFTGPVQPALNPEVGAGQDANLPAALGLLFPFIGYELCGFLGEGFGKRSTLPKIPMMAAITAAVVLFVLWCFLSLRYVPQARLLASTIPYSLTARAIAGETGRLIVGVVLLAGSLSTTNALFLAIPRMAAGMGREGLLPSFLQENLGRVLTLGLLGGAIALVMAAGLGGSPNLPVFLKASLLFWLLNYALVHLAAWRCRHRGLAGESGPVAIVCAAFLGGGCVLAVVADAERALLLTYMLLVAGALTLLPFSYQWTRKAISRRN